MSFLLTPHGWHVTADHMKFLVTLCQLQSIAEGDLVDFSSVVESSGLNRRLAERLAQGLANHALVERFSTARYLLTQFGRQVVEKRKEYLTIYRREDGTWEMGHEG